MKGKTTLNVSRRMDGGVLLQTGRHLSSRQRNRRAHTRRNLSRRTTRRRPHRRLRQPHLRSIDIGAPDGSGRNKTGQARFAVALIRVNTSDGMQTHAGTSSANLRDLNDRSRPVSWWRSTMIMKRSPMSVWHSFRGRASNWISRPGSSPHNASTSPDCSGTPCTRRRARRSSVPRTK